MTTIALQHVTKCFTTGLSGEHVITAVDDMSFVINSGEALAILGPSGCGKSTLLRLIAGLFSPDQGRVTYNGVSIAEVPSMNRGIGFVFQEGALIPHWEAKKSVGFYLRLRKREHEVPERVRQVSAITGVGIEKLMERFPSQLSGGEQQRVSIARALARDLSILLFDEPFANLDARIRDDARTELHRLLNKFPATTVYVTHDQTEAIALTRKIAVMRAGKFEQVGTFQQLYFSPVNTFVAGFVGTPHMNLFEGKADDGKWYGENFGGYALRRDLPNGAKITMGIRPQDVKLEPEGTPAVVETVTPMLAERYQLVDVWLGSERWSLTVPLDMHIDIGSTIYCALDSSVMHYFDTKSGKRIG